MQGTPVHVIVVAWIVFLNLTFGPYREFGIQISAAVTADQMEIHDAQKLVLQTIKDVANTFQKVPGSAMLTRYVRSSYQNDPVRSAIELILVVFFVRYLLAPSYSTHKQNFVTLSEEVDASTMAGRRNL